jgi:S-adenosylmethionine synthetase
MNNIHIQPMRDATVAETGVELLERKGIGDHDTLPNAATAFSGATLAPPHAPAVISHASR